MTGYPHPPLRPFAGPDVPALTADEARAHDTRAIEELGVPQAVLMENAGRGAAAVLNRLVPRGRVVAVVGAGNNGGDALVAARTLAAWGREVRVVMVADRPTEDALLHGWPLDVRVDDGLGPGDWDAALSGAGVVVDGILGTGARGAPRERQARAIAAVNRSGVPVLALDVPSGVDATTGAVPGETIRAAVTVSFGAPKVGALVAPARAYVGRHVAVEIGFPPMAPGGASARLATPLWARGALPSRGADTHKNEVGRVLVVAGGEGMAGAAILCARAAFRAGAGLVRVASVPANRDVVLAALPEAIFVDGSDAEALAEAAAASAALAVGPGLGTDEGAVAMARTALSRGGAPAVLDADALNLGASGAVDLTAAAEDRPLLLTPHKGEMKRLAQRIGPLPDDPVARARAAAAALGCAVLLKGAPSVVAERGGMVSIDTQASSDLAVAGMGDVLTGVCASLVAQGLAPATAGSVGLYLTGRAARIAGRGVALMPGDVVRRLGEACTEPADTANALDLPFVTFDADPAV